ncbi:UNVERIFIED_CONTAM: hypothetical protein FKN15_071596 [Acipenser sinensis]
MSLREELKVDDNLALMKELEDRLKSQIDKLEHLRLSASEVKNNITSALSPSSESGFDFIQQNNADLKLSIADYLDWLARLNERMETLQMNTAVFIQNVQLCSNSPHKHRRIKGQAAKPIASLHPGTRHVVASYHPQEDKGQTWSAGQNKQHLVTKNTAKLDRETEELHHQRVPLEVGKVIQQGRQNKGMTQKDLATKVNEKPQIIADYECGRAIPNNQVMGKIERALGE